jgi:hypothetical protein
VSTGARRSRGPALGSLFLLALVVPAPAGAADAVKDQLIVGFRSGTSLDRATSTSSRTSS